VNEAIKDNRERLRADLTWGPAMVVWVWGGPPLLWKVKNTLGEVQSGGQKMCWNHENWRDYYALMETPGYTKRFPFGQGGIAGSWGYERKVLRVTRRRKGLEEKGGQWLFVLVLMVVLETSVGGPFRRKKKTAVHSGSVTPRLGGERPR